MNQTDNGELNGTPYSDADKISWSADDKSVKGLLVKLVNKVELSYKEQHLTLASADIEDTAKAIEALISAETDRARLEELIARQADLAYACGYTNDQPFLASEKKIVDNRIRELQKGGGDE